MAELDLRAIGVRVQELRKRQGCTQEQLADRMNVSVQMISNLERGNKAIRIENLVHLSEILGASVDYILTGHQTTDDVAALAGQLEQLEEHDRRVVQLLVATMLTE